MKITLANLHEATAQQVFDQVATHLLTQNKQSREISSLAATRVAGNSPICAYRGENNAMCAAGCLIADKEYKPEMEGKRWIDMVCDKRVDPNHQQLINHLQQIHDRNFPQFWPQLLEGTAQKYKLQMP